METPTSLSALQSWRDFHETEDGKRLFPGLESLRWFLREHRDSLIQARVMLKVRGQWHVIRPDFDRAVIRILQEQALTTLPHGVDELAQAA